MKYRMMRGLRWEDDAPVLFFVAADGYGAIVARITEVEWDAAVLGTRRRRV